MNLEEHWKNMSEGDSDLSALINKGITKLPSKDPLEKIKRNLLSNSILGILIAGFYIFILIKFPVWQVWVCMGIVLAFTLWAIFKALLLYREMKKTVPDNNALQEMERHYAAIKKWLSIQQEVGLLIYPVSAAGGFMIGGSEGAGKPIGEIMQKPIMIIALLIAIAILVPLCFYLTKWMCKKMYGNYAEQLKQNIETLKSAI